MNSNWFLIQVLKRLRANPSCSWTYTQDADSLYATYSAGKQLLHLSLDSQEVVRLQYDKNDLKWKMRAKYESIDTLPFIRLSFVAFSSDVFLDLNNVKRPQLFRLDSTEFEECLSSRWCRPYPCSFELNK